MIFEETNSSILKCLEVLKSKRNYTDMTFTLDEKATKGSGYTSLIKFIKTQGSREDGSREQLNLVLKVNKSKVKVMQQVFDNEIWIYERVFPIFRQFQSEKGVLNPFDNVPRFYGASSHDENDAIILDNLKVLGFDVWDNQKHWIKENIELVLNTFAQFHAVSFAMKDQEKAKFDELTDGLLQGLAPSFAEAQMFLVFENIIAEIGDLLQGNLSADELHKWLNVGRNFRRCCESVFKDTEGVIIHGDGWNNNIMLKFQKKKQQLASEVYFIDWQASFKATPVADLSYFIFSSVSKNDIKHADAFLKRYYTLLAKYVEELGSNIKNLYPKKLLESEWKKFAQFGMVLALFHLKYICLDKDDRPHMHAEETDDVTAVFSIELHNKEDYKMRIKHIVRYALDKGLCEA